MTITHRHVSTNGIRMHIAEAGQGPLVLLAHGFPESWCSWKGQLTALAEAGYHAVAPDMRGYGETEAPHAADQYSIFHLVGDMVGLLDTLGDRTAVIVGHDWGAPVAWHSALFRPDRFRAVAGFSVPHFPRLPVKPSTRYPETTDAIFYQAYFQPEGVAEAEFERDTTHTIRVFQHMWSAEGAAAYPPQSLLASRTGGLLAGKTPHPAMPSWLSEADIAYYAERFRLSGFRGPLNWYRNLDRNWEQMAVWANARITQPSLFMIGEHDPVMHFRGMDKLIPSLETILPGLREKAIIPGCGHWIQRERTAEVNAALLRFLAALS